MTTATPHFRDLVCTSLYAYIHRGPKYNKIELYWYIFLCKYINIYLFIYKSSVNIYLRKYAHLYMHCVFAIDHICSIVRYLSFDTEPYVLDLDLVGSVPPLSIAPLPHSPWSSFHTMMPQSFGIISVNRPLPTIRKLWPEKSSCSSPLFHEYFYGSTITWCCLESFQLLKWFFFSESLIIFSTPEPRVW